MRDIKTRLKKLENNPKYIENYIIFYSHGDFKGEDVYYVSANANKFVCKTEKAAEELIDLIVAKYNVITIIKDDWEDINEELADGDYQEWS